LSEAAKDFPFFYATGQRFFYVRYLRQKLNQFKDIYIKKTMNKIAAYVYEIICDVT